MLPLGVDVDGDVVDGGVALGGVDWAGFWPGVGVRLFPGWSGALRGGALSLRGGVLGVVVRGGVRSPRSFGVVLGLLRGADVSLGVVPGLLRDVELSPGVVLGVFRGVEASLGLIPGALRDVEVSCGVELVLVRDVVPSVVVGRGRGVLPSVPVVGLPRGAVRSPGGVPGVYRGVVPASPAGVPPGRCAGIRPSGVPGVRLSPAPGTRPSGVGVLRGTVGEVGRGVEAGPVPAAGAVPGALAEGFLAGPELAAGLVGDVPPPDGPPELWPEAGAVPAGETAVGDVGMPPDPPSGRPPEPVGAESPAVGVGAALDWVGAVAARLSTWVPIEPPEGDDDGVLDVACVGADCGDGKDSPDTGEPPLCDGPDGLAVLGEPDEPAGLSEPPGERPPGEGSSKSDRDESDGDCVGREYGVSEEDGLLESEPGPEPESGPAPTLGPPMLLPPVSADMPLPMPVPGTLLPVPERVVVDESDPFELASDPPELEPESEFDDEELEEDEDEESEDEDDLEPLSEPESLPTSPSGSPDPPS
ncbi:hypothetical protein ACIQPS_35655 [Streptomyces sp. NPDC091290]|uniref:hypothetical protein n=1 Tax=Streptomyces sp. NPDC091290 TaxID=3365990 RepID=UPI00380EDB24